MYVINYIHKYDALSRAYLHIKSIWNVIFNQQQDCCRKYLKNTVSRFCIDVDDLTDCITSIPVSKWQFVLF